MGKEKGEIESGEEIATIPGSYFFITKDFSVSPLTTKEIKRGFRTSLRRRNRAWPRTAQFPYSLPAWHEVSRIRERD